MCSSDFFLAVLAVFFPPIAVWIKTGFCTADSIINITLTLLCFFPGLIHAWYIILKHPEQNYDDAAYEPIPGGGSRRRDLENGNVTYYYVSHQPQSPQAPSQRGYGTVNAQSQQAPGPANKSQNQGGDGGNNGGSSTHAPPTYAEAVKGDNKVQNRE